MQRQGGGGTDPSCGCDMQAGWPPASEFPRGGIQGGGANIVSFNLALQNKLGRTTRYHGEKTSMNTNTNTTNTNTTNTNNKNKNTNTNTNNQNTTNQNTTNQNNNNNLQTQSMRQSMPMSMRQSMPISMRQSMPMSMRQSMPQSMEQNENEEMNEEEEINETIDRILPNSRSTNQGTRKTSMKSTMNKVVYHGKRYFKDPESGDAYLRSANGAKGKRIGKFLQMNGKLSLNTSLEGVPPVQEAEIDIETEGVERGPEKRSSLAMNGGGMPACGSCPFPGTGVCDFYARGGGCGCSKMYRGGYRPTRKNLKYLKKWKRGESIGFTMTSSLKAKGLIPRTSRTLKGKRVVSRKYR